MTQITTASGQIITQDQALQFAASVGNDVRKIAEKAREVGLADTAEGKSFLAKTFNTDVATVEKHLGGGASGNTSTSSSDRSAYKATNSNSSSNGAASSKKTARRQQSGTLVATGDNASTGRSASASKSSGVVPITPLEVPVVRAVVHGAGNENVKDDEINDWIAAEPRTTRQMLEKMVELNLSAAQVGKAMGKTEEQINAALLDLGLDKESLDAKEVENFIPIKADEAEKVFDTVHGAGNHKISRDDIRTWMNAAPRTAREILDAMVANDVSLTQAGRAFDLTDAQMQGVIKEYGLDPNRLVTTMVSGWTDEDALRFIEKHP
ncbi:MAG TPA: hypothetical protein PLQ67_10615, partial [Burkholderiaceae bacterium]|nr:hypothetical protein [Burkholderiaceae bacterium]